jgi:hypothetical protein
MRIAEWAAACACGSVFDPRSISRKGRAACPRCGTVLDVTAELRAAADSTPRKSFRVLVQDAGGSQPARLMPRGHRGIGDQWD